MIEHKNLPATQGAGIAFVHNGHEVTFDENRFINITEMWRASGSLPSKKPSEWARHNATREFVQDLADSLRVGTAHLWKSGSGKGVGSTWAHWQIALAYAKYLSTEFHRFVNEAFREWSEENVDPDLKAKRAIDGYRRHGHDTRWIAARLEGILERNMFTDSLQAHGIEVGVGYAICTDTINKEVLGATAKQLKLDMGLPARAKTRDHLEDHKLAALKFAESLAAKLMDDSEARGNRQCNEACQSAGKAVQGALASVGLSAKAC